MKPTYLVSPPPPNWRADGGEEGNRRAAKAKAQQGVSPRFALIEWINFVDYLVYAMGARVIVMPAPPADAGIFDTCYVRDTFIYVPGRGCLMSRMKAKHRTAEPKYVEMFLKNELGLNIFGTMDAVCEGDSCYFSLPGGSGIVFGYGSRADQEAAEELGKIFRFQLDHVVALHLEPANFHLDTAGASVASRQPAVLMCRQALAGRRHGWKPDEGWAKLQALCDHDGCKLVEVRKKDAQSFGTNFRDIDGQIIAPPGLSEDYWEDLAALDYQRHEMPLPQLLGKGGGFAGCLSNPLTVAFNGCGLPPNYIWEAQRPKMYAMVSQYPTHVI